MDVGLAAALRCELEVGMLGKIVLQVHHRSFTTNKKKRILIVQHTHLIRGFQFTASGLIIGRIATIAAFGLTVGVVE